MLAPAAHRATRAHNLRSQLRVVLTQLRYIPATNNNFGATPTSSSRSISTREQVAQAHNNGLEDTHEHRSLQGTKTGRRDGTYQRHIYPNGRVIRRAGRQRRETVASLGIDSLGQRSEVVIIRDVETPSTPSKHSPIGNTGSYSERDQTSETRAERRLRLDADQRPQESDVYASIDTLRPMSVSLSKEDFDDLVKRLARSYNRAQLKGYIAQALPPAASNDAVIHTDGSHTATMSIWCRGTTNIDQRLPLQAKQSRSSALSQLAERVIRAVWGLSQHSELQEIGELEFVLSPSQFDFMRHSYASQHSPELPFFSSALARTIEVTFNASKKVLRIIGRRHDALEAAHELSNRLRTITSEQLNIKLFSSKRRHLLGLVLEQVQQSSGTHVQTDQDTLTITALSEAKCYRAKQMICQQLNLSFPPSIQLDTRPTYTTVSLAKQHANLITLSPSTVRKPLFRQTILHVDDKQDVAHLSDAQSYLARVVSNVDSLVRGIEAKTPTYVANTNKAETDHQGSGGRWSAKIGYALRPESSTSASKYVRTTFTSQLPVLGKMLDLFETSTTTPQMGLAMDSERRVGSYSSTSRDSHRQLIVYLVPSPFTESLPPYIERLPILEIRFELNIHTTADGCLWQFLAPKVSALHQNQTVSMSLPDREADLQLSRRIRTSILLPTSPTSSPEAHSLISFVQAVQLSTVSSVTEALDSLQPAHDIQVPISILPTAVTAHDDLDVPGNHPYICTGVDFSEEQLFQPKMPQRGPYAQPATELLGLWPHGMCLRLTTRVSSKDKVYRTSYGIVHDTSDANGRGENFSSTPLDQTFSQASPRGHARTGTTMGPLITSGVALLDLSTLISRSSALDMSTSYSQ